METTWSDRYLRPLEITYDQGSAFMFHELKISLNKTEYKIIAKPITLGSTSSNALLEHIYQVLGNRVRTFNIYQPMVGKTKHGQVL